ncbi:acyl carrier protein [Streptomyces sioyaensis]|uniref:Acyl carrier protein n=1 Tax=Streptomyces sioyaensis TaxID=67364 RepID=A0A4Q1R749_9ACTN|nr:acyl carrier protein [Streptomyces sioyaensis]MBM4791674.1 acyl carrier protein [Streptomyces sioyaensis]RXS69148.1 acyl carrier protein [Streptomyces sioyaensis]
MPTSTELITTTLTETFDLDPADVTPERTFEELGLDSLALVEMGLMLQERTGISLDDVPLHTTIDGLAALMDRAEAEQALTAAPNSSS